MAAVDIAVEKKLFKIRWVRDSSEKPAAGEALSVARGLVAYSPAPPQGWF